MYLLFFCPILIVNSQTFLGPIWYSFYWPSLVQHQNEKKDQQGNQRLSQIKDFIEQQQQLRLARWHFFISVLKRAI